MAEGKCYTMNPDRAKEGVPHYISNRASDKWWWVETSCGEVVVSSSSETPVSSSSEVVSSSSETPVSSSSEVVSSSSETPVSSSSEIVSSSSEVVSSSSEVVVSTCIAFKNGTGDYNKNCYNSGLRNMEAGKCYTMNADRVKEGVPQWINEEANQTWWWSVVSCDATSVQPVIKKSNGRDNGTTGIVAAVEVKAGMTLMNNTLNIVSNSNGSKSLKVFSVRGDMLHSETFSGASKSFDLSQFAGKGAVIVRLVEGHKVLATKRVAVR